MKLFAWYFFFAAVCDSDAGLLRADFGTGAQLVGSEPCSLVGDFNGDGVNDRAWLARMTGSLKAGVRSANPWHLSEPGKVGLAVSLAGPAKQLYFLSDADFFSSPIWSHPAGLISVRRQGKGHVMLVATESGEDMRLSFDGKAWLLRP